MRTLASALALVTLVVSLIAAMNMAIAESSGPAGVPALCRQYTLLAALILLAVGTAIFLISTI